MDTRRKNKNVIVQLAKGFENIDVKTNKLKKLVKAVCNRFNLFDVTVSIALVNTNQIRKINRRFLKRNRSTDVISFDLSDNNTGDARLFELIVNAELAVKEANLRGHCAEAELALYITHGLLHNIGFDDSQPGAAKKMHKTENEILQQYGFGTLYN
jgi:probable rRNA maturation factor